MGRHGNCLDNVPIETFFHTLKVERVYHRVSATRTDARGDFFACIEGFNNSRRLHSAVGYRSQAWTEWRPNSVHRTGGRSRLACSMPSARRQRIAGGLAPT